MPVVSRLPLSFAPTPRVLWVELTSKCPFDCVFCSRKSRRGAGEHMPFALYARLVGQLDAPRTIVLNYSGESTIYPELLPAIRLARSTGALVELVSAFAAVPRQFLKPLAESGLGRLTVSVHATDAARFASIYRHSSTEALGERLREFAAICRETPGAPSLDFGFVAMDGNLDQLEPVAALAASLGVRDVLIFPVIRRDEIPVSFPAELDTAGQPLREFRQKLNEHVTSVRNHHSAIRFTICNPQFETGHSCVGRIPVPYAWPLPPGAQIHTCEQNPWETAHILSNGDVVACEVLDHEPLGNLARQSLADIWHGAAYQRFRDRYRNGEVQQCRNCVWKRAYQPSALEPEVLAARGGSAQLLHGWHEPADEGIVWSTQIAAAVLRPKLWSQTLHVCGVLPPGPAGDPNELAIEVNGREIGRIANPWEDNMEFGLDFAVPAGDIWELHFRTRHVYRASERGTGGDRRDLGFALVMMASRRAAESHSSRRRQQLETASRWLKRADDIGRKLAHHKQTASVPAGAADRPGVTVLIPERDNPRELEACLDSVAAAGIGEPLDLVVLVNGSQRASYEALATRHPAVRWSFVDRALGFAEAVRRGLQLSHHDWVYLLNNDVVIEPAALSRVLQWRAPDVFAIGSQIFFKDTTRFREETNLTSFHLEDGLATVHDRIPQNNGVTECFYVGGGASLFRRKLLERFAGASTVYAPFYWEDVEWGWRARKLGYRVLFSASSVVWHSHRATIAKHYSPEQIEEVTERNRLLFQLRNLTGAAFTERALQEAASAPEPVARYLLRHDVLFSIARARVWNHLAPVGDSRVLEDAAALRP